MRGFIGFALILSVLFIGCKSDTGTDTITPTNPVSTAVTHVDQQSDKPIIAEPSANVPKSTETSNSTSNKDAPTQAPVEPLTTNKPNNQPQQDITKTKTVSSASNLKYVPYEKLDSPEFTNKTGYNSFNKDIDTKLTQIVGSNFDPLSTKMGISVAVVSGNKLWSASRGSAKEGVSLRTDSPIGIMSTSKTFLSALILNQVEDGLYDMDDKISDLLKGHSLYQKLNPKLFPDSTVEELLLMRGGHGDKDTNSQYINYVVTKPDWHPTDYLALTTKPGANPGGYEYSNNSSVLLGLIAQYQAQTQLAKLYQEKLFSPLSLQIGFRPATRIPSNMAAPHANYSMYGGVGGFGDLTKMKPLGAPDWYQIDYYEQDGRLAWAGAGGFTTAENMAIWGYELYSQHGKALSDSSRKALIGSIIEENIILAGVTQNYGYHIARRYHPMSDGTNLMTYGHPGGGGGYSSILMYSPKMDISISVLANSELGHQRGVCDAPYMATGLTCIAYDILNFLNTEL
tara:strand:- start:5512 stop:7047 length:1536 start_codon:yes stop_codon:yes gene_type:complete